MRWTGGGNRGRYGTFMIRIIQRPKDNKIAKLEKMCLCSSIVPAYVMKLPSGPSNQGSFESLSLNYGRIIRQVVRVALDF